MVSRVLAVFEIFRRVERLQVDLFERFAGPFFERLARLLLEARAPLSNHAAPGSRQRRLCVNQEKFSSFNSESLVKLVKAVQAHPRGCE